MTNNLQMALPSFTEAWAKMEAKGYRYGRDALENVELGYAMAQDELEARTSPPADDVVEAARKAAERFREYERSHREQANPDDPRDTRHVKAERNREMAEMLEAALRNAEQPEPRTSEGWQDISSAPKDGTRFIGAYVEQDGTVSSIAIVRWQTAEQIAAAWGDGVDGDDVLTKFLPGWDDDGDEACINRWMPLPPAPEPQP